MHSRAEQEVREKAGCQQHRKWGSGGRRLTAAGALPVHSARETPQVRPRPTVAEGSLGTSMHTPAHACTHMYMHAHACTHTPAHACARMHMCTHIHMPAHTCTWMHTPAHIHLYTHMHAHIHMCTHLHTYIPVLASTCTHAHACAHAHACTRLHCLGCLETQSKLQCVPRPHLLMEPPPTEPLRFKSNP